MHVLYFGLVLAPSVPSTAASTSNPVRVRLKVYLEAKSLASISAGTLDVTQVSRTKFSLISEKKAIAINALAELARTLELRVIHLQRILEVWVRFHPDIQIKGHGFVICDLEVFVKSSANRRCRAIDIGESENPRVPGCQE